MFGIDFTFVWTAVALAITYFFVNKFVFKRLAKNMDERSAAIAAGIARGEELKVETDKFNVERDEWRKDSNAQQKAIIDGAKVTANREADRILAEARSEATLIKDNAEAHSARELEAKKAELTRESLALTLEVASKIIAANVDNDKNRALAEEFLSNEKAAG